MARSRVIGSRRRAQREAVTDHVAHRVAAVVEEMLAREPDPERRERLRAATLVEFDRLRKGQTHLSDYAPGAAYRPGDPVP